MIDPNLKMKFYSRDDCRSISLNGNVTPNVNYIKDDDDYLSLTVSYHADGF